MTTKRKQSKKEKTRARSCVDSAKPPKVKKQKKEQVHAAYIDFTGEDAVITDPCYLVKHDDWLAFCERELNTDTPHITKYKGVDMLVAGTIYGDWMCTVTGTESTVRKSFGTFTADAGLVCACALNKTMLDELKSVMTECYVTIPKFVGRIMITHKDGDCTVSGIGTSDGSKVEFRSLQIG